MNMLSAHFHIRRRYLRSVNLERDGELGVSLEGYVLTPRALEALERIVECYRTPSSSRAWTLTGVYGTGKSAFANFLAALCASSGSDVRARAQAIMRDSGNSATQASRLKNVFPSQGLVRAIVTGRREPLGHTLVRALARGVEGFWATRGGRRPAAVNRVLALRKRVESGKEIVVRDLPDLVADVAAASGTGLLFIIDELGKVLEHASRSGGADDVYLLQQLAELPSGRENMPVLVVGLLHQAFSDYTSLLSTAQRAEWEKVQGRFEEIPFAESPEQMLRLLGEALEASPPISMAKAIRADAEAWHAWLKDIHHHPYVAEVLSPERITRVYPLHPVSALVLPSLCTRYGQNDRSLFTFLASSEEHTLSRFLEERTGSAVDRPLLRLPDAYDYFINSGRGVGATRFQTQRWTEIQAAIEDAAAVETPELEALKTIGTLNLVTSAGPLRASRALVLAALCSRPNDSEEQARWSAVLADIQARRLVTYREQIDEYRLWAGSDFNIEGGLESRMAAERRSLAEILSDVVPLAPVVAQRHAYRTGTLRYFERWYADGGTALSALRSRQAGSDGVIVYWMEDAPPARVPKTTQDGKPLILLVTRASRSLQAAARELLALTEMERREVALQTDGVARREVRQRLVLAQEVLDEAVRDAIETRRAQLWSGKRSKSVAKFNAALSDVCDRVYTGTPILWNELINRRELTSQGARAQRELIAALLTNCAVERLGLEGNGPEYAMYASLLQSTGIHRQEHGEWIIGPPRDNGVAKLWSAIESFCQCAKIESRPISDLYGLLEAPPYGVKSGIIPVFLVAVLIYHADDVSVYQDGTFLPMLTPAHFELLVKQPGRFAVKCFELVGLRWEVFRELESLLHPTKGSPRAGARNATMLSVVRPLVRFATSLPPVTKNADDLTAEARMVRDALLSVREPDQLLFDALPKALGQEPFAPGESGGRRRQEEFRRLVFGTLRELQSYYEQVLSRCRVLIHEAFGVRADVTHLRQDLRVRASYLTGQVIERRLKSFVVAAVNEDASDKEWLEALLMILADRPADTWTKQDQMAFEMNVTEMARRFANLEALQREAVRDGVEGFDARRVTITEPGGQEVHRLIWVDRQERPRIQAQADSIAEQIVRVTEEHQRQAILVALMERILQIPKPGVIDVEASAGHDAGSAAGQKERKRA